VFGLNICRARLVRSDKRHEKHFIMEINAGLELLAVGTGECRLLRGNNSTRNNAHDRDTYRDAADSADNASNI
jgi:hypothetical protein